MAEKRGLEDEQESWKNFATKMKNKRMKQTKTSKEKDVVGIGENILSEKEMIIQRLASEASGKAMKYERLGPQEFVPYNFDEISLDNIKTACYNHYADRLTHLDMVCDVLASQNGPSCSKLSHLPNFKKIHVRFIKVCAVDRPKSSSDLAISVLSKLKPSTLLCSRMHHSTMTPLAYNKSLKKTTGSSLSQSTFPHSLSVSTMLGLGKVISKTLDSPISVEVSEFCMNSMAWKPPVLKEYYVEKSSFARGGFREVFKAKDLQSDEFVVKKLLPTTFKMMDEINKVLEKNETLESQCRKAVQMHMLAKHFTEQLRCIVSKEGLEFGSTFTYKSAKLGKVLSTNEYIVIEDFIPGDFVKYLNNDGIPIIPEDSNLLEKIEKAECLAHFSYEKSKKELILLDIQGSSYILYDPEIASMKLVSDTQDLQFCMGNLAEQACTNFISGHICNRYCGLLCLDHLSLEP